MFTGLEIPKRLEYEQNRPMRRPICVQYAPGTRRKHIRTPRLLTVKPSLSGVAREAKLIAIQVFSQFPSSDCGGSPGVIAYTSNIIGGLERIYALRVSHSVAATNLSLGGGQFSRPCDGDPTKVVIDRLRTAGIATVISSENNGSINALSAPGCIATAINLGSTTKSDNMSSFSNSASILDCLALGRLIESSIPRNGFAIMSGTSMAASIICV